MIDHASDYSDEFDSACYLPRTKLVSLVILRGIHWVLTNIGLKGVVHPIVGE